MTDRILLAEVLVAAPLAVAVIVACLPRRWTTALAVGGAAVTGALAVTVSGLALADAAHPRVGSWIALDAAGGLLVGVIGLVGLVSVLISPAYLATATSSLVADGRRATFYYVLVNVFWAALLAVPLAGNLGTAWLLVEATTAASALLVGFSGSARALEAGWKYLILTSLGLGIALLGIVLLAAGTPGGGLGALTWRTLPTYAGDPSTALVAYLLLLVGLAAKIGWAPVHNWLPDAHSQAPAPVSALLSAALLPAVLLVAWRCEQGLAPVIGQTTARNVLIGFGLASVAVAVPFLARQLAWKRLLAYSSLEHMGVIALGIGFGSPLALAGVAVHLTAHAVAKTLGFVVVTPLLAHRPSAAREAVTGIGGSRPVLAAGMGVCLGTLSGLPPSPIFVSELLIIAGGFQAGRPWIAGATALLLALAFLGLSRSLLETTAWNTSADAPEHERTAALPGLRAAGALAAVSTVVLVALVGVSAWLPATDLVDAFLKGVS
ncbi:MAG: hydrogenase-4 component [Actinomycetota bacterium]|nr:hydrogenase-4 component [Actinomycetota bacterium]